MLLHPFLLSRRVVTITFLRMCCADDDTQAHCHFISVRTVDPFRFVLSALVVAKKVFFLSFGLWKSLEKESRYFFEQSQVEIEMLPFCLYLLSIQSSYSLWYFTFRLSTMMKTFVITIVCFCMGKGFLGAEYVLKKAGKVFRVGKCTRKSIEAWPHRIKSQAWNYKMEDMWRRIKICFVFDANLDAMRSFSSCLRDHLRIDISWRWFVCFENETKATYSHQKLSRRSACAFSVAHTFTIFRFSFFLFLNQIEPRVIVVVCLTHERTHKIFRLSNGRKKEKKNKRKTSSGEEKTDIFGGCQRFLKSRYSVDRRRLRRSPDCSYRARSEVETNQLFVILSWSAE